MTEIEYTEMGGFLQRDGAERIVYFLMLVQWTDEL